VPDWDNTESRERDEDAAWRDLVARFDAPPITQRPVPWPEREDVLPPQSLPSPGADGTRGAEQARETDETGEPNGAEETRETNRTTGIPGLAEAEGSSGVHDSTAIPGVSSPGGLPGSGGADGPQGTQGVKGVRGFDDEGVRGALDPDGVRGSREPDVIEAARHRRRTSARSIRPRQAPADTTPANEDDRYIPPPPPPLPTLDSIAKGAWVALFGGPAYLVVATAAHWELSGFAVFCAVAAFVTGFAVLVLRMNSPGPGGPDDGDDGAVV
jgi:hypothetical protein